MRYSFRELIQKFGDIKNVISIGEFLCQKNYKTIFTNPDIKVIKCASGKKFVSKYFFDKDSSPPQVVCNELFGSILCDNIFKIACPKCYVVENEALEIWFDYIEPTFDIGEYENDFVYTKMSNRFSSQFFLYNFLTGNFDGISRQNLIPQSKCTDDLWDFYVIDFQNIGPNTSYNEGFGKPLYGKCAYISELPYEKEIFPNLETLKNYYDIQLEDWIFEKYSWTYESDILVYKRHIWFIFYPYRVFKEYIEPSSAKALLEKIKKDKLLDILKPAIDLFNTSEVNVYAEEVVEFMMQKAEMVRTGLLSDK